MSPENRPGWDPIARATQQYCLRVYGCEPISVRIQLLHGPEVILPMPQWGLKLNDADPPPQEVGPPEPLRELIVMPQAPLENQRIRKAWHSHDWREVHLEGRRWILSPSPAIVVRVLWQAALAGRPDVDQKALLREANSTSNRVPELFKKIPNWQMLITNIEPLRYRLACADVLQELLEAEERKEREIE